MKKLFVFLLLPVSLPCIAGANGDNPQPITTFGITLKQPLPFSECEFHAPSRRTKRLEYRGTFPEQGPCYERGTPGNAQALVNETVQIKFPLNAKPNLSKYGSVAALLVSGRVERMWFWTHGLKLQDHDLSTLSEKFGSPSRTSESVGRNSFGATFAIKSATWDMPGAVAVSFVGSDGTTDRGLVVIESPLGKASYEAGIKAVLGGKTEL